METLSNDIYALRIHQKLAYSVGHFFNDLCASMWFTYLLIFLTSVLGFSNIYAGYLLLLGQIVDAVCTPLIGYESDRIAGFCNYGKRKSWHLLGTIFVTISFAFIFLRCFGCDGSDDWAKFIYYTPFITAFQFGWASTQIAHMTLVSELTPDESERVGLNSYRNAFTLLASVVVYGIAWGLFNTAANEKQWSPADAQHFMILMFSVVGIGILTSACFHIFTPEHDHSMSVEHINSSSRSSEPVVVMNWLDWMKEYQFYMVGFCYMCSRLVSNVSQTYWPFYLTESLKMVKKFSAIIPLVVFVTGFFTSLAMRPVNQLLGRKLTFFVGTILVGSALVWMWFLNKHTAMEIFGPAFLIGAGSTTMLVTSLSMVADIIGENTSSSAFVYGVMSFGDKLSSGAALMLMQEFRPTCKLADDQQENCPELSWYFHHILIYVLAAFVAASVILIVALSPTKLGALKKFHGHPCLTAQVPDEITVDHHHQGSLNGFPTSDDDETQPLIHS